MDRLQIATKLAMDGLGLPCSMESFDERLIVQKAVYLAQAAGVNLGYYFRWYLRGPYAPSLAKSAFAICEELGASSDELEQWKLDSASAERLQKLAPLMAAEDTEERRASKLELLASVHYLVDRGQVPSDDVHVIEKKLLDFDKDFNGQQITDALGELKSHGLL